MSLSRTSQSTARPVTGKLGELNDTAAASTSWFSDNVVHSGACSLSPNAQFIASVLQYRLVVRAVETMKPVSVFTCGETIDAVQWGADSAHVLCFSSKKGVVQAFRLNSEWSCRIDDEHYGIAQCRWSADCKSIICVSEHGLKVTAWSLEEGRGYQIMNPKFPTAGMLFSKNGKHFALIERHDCVDHIGVYSCKSWQMLARFALEMDDAADFLWAPDGSSICVWSAPTELHLALFSLEGHCVWRVRDTLSSTLGVRSVSWSSCGGLLALGGVEEKLRILNALTGKVIVEWDLQLALAHPSTTLFEEAAVEEPSAFVAFGTKAKVAAPSHGPYAMAQITPATALTKPSADATKLPAKTWTGFSSDSSLVACRNENTPCTIWIWSVASARLVSVVNGLLPQRQPKWHPNSNVLACYASTNKLFLWSSTENARSVLHPDNSFKINDVQWGSGEGHLALLVDTDKACVNWPFQQSHPSQ